MMNNHRRAIISSPADIAASAAEDYFRALASDIPFDTAPGGVNLVEHCIAIEEAIEAEHRNGASIGVPSFGSTAELVADAVAAKEDAVRRAGYLLGVAIGRRLGGVR